MEASFSDISVSIAQVLSKGYGRVELVGLKYGIGLFLAYSRLCEAAQKQRKS
jgi:hypothetical protein